MATRASALVGRLQDRRAGGAATLARGAALVDDRFERRGEFVDAFRCLDSFAWLAGQRTVGRPPSDTLMRSLPLLASKLIEVDENRSVIVLARLDGERRGPRRPRP